MKYSLSFTSFMLIFVSSLFSQNTLNNASLTASTPSAAAFSLRSLSSGYTGPAITVRRSSDNAEAVVAFDVTGRVSPGSLVTFIPGVIVGSSFGTIQGGTISSDAARTGTVTIRPNRTGTITTSNVSAAVTGTGTSFTTEIIAGDRLFNAADNNFLGIVAAINSNTSLSLANYATLSATNLSFKTTAATVTGTGTNFTGELLVGNRLFTAGNTYLGTVTAITNGTSLTLNAADAVAVTAINYKGSSSTITGTGTNFTSLAPGDLLISNNTTLGIVASVTDANTLILTNSAGGAASGMPFKSTAGTIPFSTFYGVNSVYVSTWFDQSGNGRNAVQTKPGNQARIVNGGSLYIVNGRPSMEFSTSLAAFFQTALPASYLNNTPYTVNSITAEATTNPVLQFPVSTTGGNGPSNTVLHIGYRSSSQFTIAQYDHDQNFSSTPSTSLELHTAVKLGAGSSQFYKNDISQGVSYNGAPADLLNAGLLSIGYFPSTVTYYNGSISEVIIFPVALPTADISLLDDNQLLYYSIATAYWTGAVSTDWTNTGNWSNGAVPTLTVPSIVVIPAGKPNYPVISSTSPALSISIESGASLIVTGTLQLAGTLNNQGTCTATSGTIQYVGAAPQTIYDNAFSGNTVGSIVLNNSMGVILNENLAISTNLTFTSGKLSMGSSTLTLGGSVTNTITGGLKGGPNSSLIINSTVSPTLSFDQTTVNTTNVLNNLTINSSGQVITLANNLILLGTGITTFTAGKLAIGAATLTIRGAVINTINEGLRGSIASKLIVDGSISPTLSFDQTTPGTTNALNNLTLNCPGQTVTLNRTISFPAPASLIITSGVLADGGNQLVSSGGLTLSGTFKLGSPTVATTWPGFASRNITATGTVEYAAGIAQTVSAVPVYQHLTISAAGGTIAAGNLSVNGILTLSAANPSATSGCLSMSTYTLTMGAAATTVGVGDVTGIVKRTTILPNINYTMGNEFSFITFPATGTLPSQMSIKITIGTTPSWRTGAIQRYYDFIQTGGTGTKAVISAHYLDAELNGNNESKLVDYSYRVAGAVLTEDGKSNFNTTQNWVVLSNVNVSFFSSSFGNVALSLDESTLTSLTWNGSTSSSWITATNWTPNGGPSTNTNLIIPDATTTPNDPFLPASASNGSITIENGGILNADPGAQLMINNSGLAWSNMGGTFNAASSNIIFTNADAAINGSTNFNNITINSGAELLMSTGSLTRIAGTITNNGTWRPGLLNNTIEYNGMNQSIVIPNGSTQSYYNLTVSGGGTSILPAASLNVSGDLAINGTISVAGNTLVMNGVNAQSIGGTIPVILNNLTLNNSIATVNLTRDMAVSNTLTLTAGGLSIGNQTLTLSGNVINSMPNGITGGPGSNLVISGPASPTLSFDQSSPGISDALNNFIINSIGQQAALGSDLSIEGNLLFTAGKLAIGGNTLYLKGSVTNTVIEGFVGSAASNLFITGLTSPDLSFAQTTPGTTNLLNNFSVNSPGQIISLIAPLIIGGNLDLAAGLITTSNTNSLTLNETAIFSGGSGLSFVNGPLNRKTLGTATVDFPVGKNGYYRPVQVTPVAATPGIYNAEYFYNSGPAGTYAPGMTAIANDEYWDIGRSAGPDATVTLVYTADNSWTTGYPSSMDNIFVAHYNGSTWDEVSGTIIPGNTGSGATAVTSRQLTSFSPFTFAYGMSIPLPVKLLDFKASATGQAVILTWISANEFSFDRYDLERSANGRNFYTITSVKATNTPFTRSYGWLDNAPVPAVNYYRLKMIDIDGHFTYSAIIRMDITTKRSLTMYPNPVVDNTLRLTMYGQPKGDYSFSLYNYNGVKVMTGKLSHDGNNTVKNINIASYLNGIYYLELTGPTRNKTTLAVIIE